MVEISIDDLRVAKQYHRIWHKGIQTSDVIDFITDELKKYNCNFKRGAYGWYLIFENEEDLIMFILKN
jgi:hypothetical protein